MTIVSASHLPRVPGGASFLPTTYAFLLCVASYMKLASAIDSPAGRQGLQLGSWLEIAGLILVFCLVQFRKLKIANGLIAVLFFCFAIYHAFHLHQPVINCGCFGAGNYSPIGMMLGCLLVAVSAWLGVRIGTRFAAKKQFLAFCFCIAGACCFFFSFSSPNSRGKILQLCQYSGYSTPVSGPKELCQRLENTDWLLISSRCETCQRWLRAHQVPAEFALTQRYWLIVNPRQRGDWRNLIPFHIPRDVALDIPVLVQTEGNKLKGCVPPTQLGYQQPFFDLGE